MLFLQLIVLICLAFIFYQDMRYRAVYWICFPILSAFLFGLKYSQTGVVSGLTDAAYGLLFLLVQLLFLWIYFSVKHKRLLNITNDYLGWGDILFLAAIPFYLSPGNYVLFYVASLIVVLMYAIGSTRSNNHKHIPLAGLQALLLGLLMIVDFFWPAITLYNDSWIYVFIT